MKRRRILKYSFLMLTALLAAVLVLSLSLGVSDIAAAPESAGFIGTDGSPISAVAISDLAELNRLERANYTPNEYVIPQHEARGEVVDIGRERVASRGTYQFVILNLDPADPDFHKKAAALEPYLRGDNYWHFTLYLPAVWSSAVVYTRTVPIGFVGAISDYDFIEYSDYEDKTELHSTSTEPLFVDVKLYARKRAISDDRLDAATIVTIHYEGEGNKLAGLTQSPLIGSDSAVRAAVRANGAAPIALAVLGAITLSVFIFLCFLKRTLSFLPQLLIALGVFGAICSAIVLLGATSSPYFWSAVGAFSLAFVIFASFLCLRVKVGAFPLWIVFAAAAAINCVVSFVFPLLPSGALGAYDIYRAVVYPLLSLAVFASATISARGEKEELSMLVDPLIAGVAALAALLPRPSSALANPVYWLFAVILCTTLVVSFRVFVRTERRNRSLTANLQEEVERQTDDLKAAITERDDLLRHVSHDTKSPIAGIERFLDVLKRREKDGEQLKALNVVAQKTEELKRTLRDLGAYAKLNFVAEKSEPFDVGEALSEAYESLEPDCCASGIVLTCAHASIHVFGKKNALVTVLNNLILNAVEHAECCSISLAAYKRKNVCAVTVTDDGKGIDADRDVFLPYNRKPTEANEGLGLYLCKATMKSMGGDISYERNGGKLTFTLTLPLS